LRRIACLLVGVVVLAVPASASALGTSASLSGTAKGPKGYKVLWYATTAHQGSSNVGLTITFLKLHGIFGRLGYYYQSHSYSFNLPPSALKLNKKLKTGKLKASLGKFGKVKISFTQNAKTKKTKPPAHCTGPTTLSRLGTLSGKITFSPAGLGKVGKLKKGATATRASSNVLPEPNCPPLVPPKNCLDQVGQESASSNEYSGGFGFNSVSVSASRPKTGGLVTENASAFLQMAAPGSYEGHYLTIVGAADRLAQAAGVATLKGAGSGITGTLTLTGTGANTINPQAAPCATFVGEQLTFPVVVTGKLTFAFDSGTQTLDPTTPGWFTNGSWSIFHH
jgi:hypothetical protein